ncbi:GtrA family protein [Pseudomonas sp. NPDC089743]|uniref:GtrA family protein n=1 Tax=Pseudomonas sp. NPDC089743 TaxID=3364471 RepID=UPI00382CDA57
MGRFARYGLVGIGNTALHGLVFWGALALGLNQGQSNLLAFAVAATVSYHINARFTFAVRPAGSHYLVFMAGMGGISLVLGAIADWAQLSPWLTVLTFSAISLIVGYSYSHAVVFKRREA